MSDTSSIGILRLADLMSYKDCCSKNFLLTIVTDICLEKNDGCQGL